MDFVLTFPSGGDVVLEGFADANFGTSADRKSISSWPLNTGFSLIR